IWTRVQKRFDVIAREEDVRIACTPLSSDEPARSDPALRRAIRQAAKSAGLATMDLPSGAGHDAQNLPRLAPTAMIFVPSRGGISHSPNEFTPWEQVAHGAEVLYRTILLLDSQLDPN